MTRLKAVPKTTNADSANSLWSRLLLIRASAGSGKTHQLSSRLIGNILAGAEIDSILAVTFTRKAAGEIRDRVLRRLAEACLFEDKRTSLQQELLDAPDAEQIMAALNPQALAVKLHELTQNQHRLHIMTLDSFFSLLARAFGFELQLPSGWSLYDTFDGAVLRRDAIRATIESLTTVQLQTLMHMLSKDELRTSLSDELNSTASECYSVFQVAAEDAWSHPVVPAAPEATLVNQAIRTLENCEARTKSAQAAFRKLANYAIVGDWLTLSEERIVQNLAAGNESYANGKLTDTHLNDAALILYQHAQTIFLSQLRAQTLATRDILKHYEGHFQRLKLQRRIIGFDDLTFTLMKFLVSQRSADGGLSTRLLNRMDTNLQHLLLDEFQDTSPVQWRVIEPFLRTALRTSGSLFCVGDTKQAIYGWRGGCADLFDALQQRVEGLDSTTLAASYRSSPVIIETVNRCFSRLMTHPDLGRAEPAIRAFENGFPEHITKRQDLPGYAILETAPANDSEEEETCNPCLRRAIEVVRHWRMTRPEADIAILTRTNRPIGTLIALLRDAGIEASQEGGNPLTDSPAVEMVLAALLLADHPGDLVSAFHLANGPLAVQLGLSPYTFMTGTSSPTDTPRHVATAAASAIIRERLFRDGVATTVAWLCKPLMATDVARDRTRLEQLLDLCDKFVPLFRGRASDFVQFVEQERVALPSARPVRVMTMHMAKGLEFDGVVLPQLDIDLIGTPDLLVTQSDDPVEPPLAVMRSCGVTRRPQLSQAWQRAFEQVDAARVTGTMCLAYVAMTRAKQAMHMIVPTVKRATQKKFSALLINALGKEGVDPAVPGAVLYEAGDANWRPVRPPKAPAPAITESKPALQIRLKPAPQRPHRAAPSSTSGLPFSFVSELLDPERRIGEVVGLLLHHWFAQIQWIDDHMPDATELTRLAAVIPSHSMRYIELPVWVDRYRKWLQQAPLKTLLSRARYAGWPESGKPSSLHIRNEMLVAGSIDGQATRGRIDRVVIAYAAGRPIAAEIIDFKTDAIEGNTERAEAEVTERYRPQLEQYRRLLSEQIKLSPERIKLTLSLVGQQSVIELT